MSTRYCAAIPNEGITRTDKEKRWEAIGENKPINKIGTKDIDESIEKLKPLIPKINRADIKLHKLNI